MDKMRALELFVRVAECGSFSRAAESLDLANATITTSVRNLERLLDATLIRRDTRRQALTKEGELVLARARDLLRSLSELEDAFHHQTKEPSGPLHIEAPISFGQTLLIPTLAEFAVRHPKIKTSVTLTKERHNLIAHAIDVAVRMDHVEAEVFVARPIFETQYVVCGTAKVVSSLPAHPADLDPSLCIGVMPEDRRHPMAWEFRRGGRTVVIEPEGPLNFNIADGAIGAIQNGLGVVCILGIYAAPHLEAGNLVRAYPQWNMGKRTGYLVMTRESVNLPKVRAFASFLDDVLRRANWSSARGVVPVKASRQRRKP